MTVQPAKNLSSKKKVVYGRLRSVKVNFYMLYKEQINNSLLYSSTLSKVQNYKSWFTFHFVVLK